MKAEIWEIKICEGVLGASHGMYKTIKELYIPEINVSLNIVNETINCFLSYSDRYKGKDVKKVEDVEIEENDVNIIAKYVTAKYELSVIYKQFKEKYFKIK